MLESEIKEQIITQAKNINYLNSIISEIDKLPENEADKRADEYLFCHDKLLNTDCLDDSITRRRLLHEMQESTITKPETPNLYRENINTAIHELISLDYIYWIDNRYSLKDKISVKKIIIHLVQSFYRKQYKFGDYISRIDFIKWVCEVFKTMNYSVTEDSIKKQIDSLL